ncbi:DUF6888 family protein [Nostoc sp.]
MRFESQTNIELIRVDERTGNLYVLAGENLDFEIKRNWRV